MSGSLKALHTEDEFERTIAEATRPVLVDVSATWCGPCQRLTPILDDLIDRRPASR